MRQTVAVAVHLEDVDVMDEAVEHAARRRECSSQ